MLHTHPIFAFSDRATDLFAALAPTWATYGGIAGHDHELDDLSPEGFAELHETMQRFRRELAALPEATDGDGRLAIAVLEAFTGEMIEAYERREHLRDISHSACALGLAREAVDAQDRTSAEGWHNVARRLAAMDAYNASWQRSIAEGLDRGELVARRQVLSLIRQLRASVAPDGTYSTVVAGYEGDGDALRADLDEGLEVTRRACEETARWLEVTYLPAALDEDGVGREEYEVQARRHLGTQIDLAETYGWGWDLIDDLSARMVAVAREIDDTRDLAGVIARLKTDPAMAAPTQAAFVELMLERQQRAIELLDGSHFGLPVEIREVDVRLAAPGNPLGAWYIGPSEDFARPGSLWWSIGSKEPVPLWEEVSTGYHEGFPGHHMQIGLSMTMTDRLSRLHRLLYWKAGSGEGWALYAERLMDELGFLDAPMYVLGYLAAAMLRACRVVIDIGCHLGLTIPARAPFHPGERWRYELAVEMLTDLAMLDRDVAESEATRYLGWPGQAISYKLGERAIVELRDELRRSSVLDPRDFHARVLGAGCVGLDLLRSVVRGELDA